MKLTLDVGTGDGAYMVAGAMRNPEDIYVGLDINPAPANPDNLYQAFKDHLVDAARKRNSLPELMSKDVENAINEAVLYADAEGLDKYPEGRTILGTPVISVIFYRDVDFIGEFGYLLSETGWENPLEGLSRQWVLNEIGKMFLEEVNDTNVAIREALGYPLKPALRERLEKVTKRVRYVIGDAENMPFRDNTFDYVRGSGIKWLLEKTWVKEELERCFRS